MSYFTDMDGPDEEPEEEPPQEEDDDGAGPRFADEIGAIADQLTEARKIIAALLYPDTTNAADGVTVADVWRKQARQFLGVKTITLEPRIVDDVRVGLRKYAIVPATGPTAGPRFEPPPAAREGDIVELFDGAVSLGAVKVTKTQTLKMEVHASRFPDQPSIAWTQCGRDMAAFPLYEAEEVELTRMDGWPDKAARFAHYCPDGKRFDGHIIFWDWP